MATVKGVGVVWGIGSFTFTGITAGTPQYQDYGIENTADIAYIKNASGDDAGMVISNIHRKFRITVIPSDTTIALSKTNAINWLPSPGTSVEFTDTDASLTTKKTVVISSTLTRTNTGAASCSLELDSGVSVDTLGAAIT